MNLYEIEKSGYKCFDHIEEARNKTAQVNAIKYIKHMASLSNTDISTWDLLSLFKNGDRQEVVTNKNKINQVFFAYRELPKPGDGSKSKLPESLVTQLLEAQKHKRGGSWQAAQNNRDANLANATQRRMQWLSYLEQAHRYAVQVDALQGKTQDLPKDVEMILADGFWTNPSMSSDNHVLRFETLNNVVVSYVDEKHGVFTQVDFGKFKVSYNVRSGTIECTGIENNFNIGGSIFNPGYPHPHVSGTAICYGHTPEADAAFTSGDVVEIFEVTKKVLLSYNPGSPYVTMEKFKFAEMLENKSIPSIVDHPQWKLYVSGKLKLADVKPESPADKAKREKRAKQMQKYHDTGNIEHHPDFDHFDGDDYPCDADGERIEE